MVQRRDGARLALKAIGKLLCRELNRDVAIQTSVARFPHLSHAARAQRRLNFIWTELRARGKSHRCWQL